MKHHFLCFLTAIVIILSCMTVSVSAENPETSISSEKSAIHFVETLFGGSPELLDGNVLMTKQMLQAIGQAGGWTGMALSLTSALGPLVSVSGAYKGTLQGYQVWYVPCVFSGMSVDLLLVMDQEMLAGLSTGPFTELPKAESAEKSFDEVDLSVPVSALNRELPGTLTLPQGEGPFPAVVLIHGSGPSDRDETVMNQKPFRDLAEALPTYGIAVFRYDKRSYTYPSECAADPNATLMDETVDDAVSAFRMLSEQDRIDPDRIFILGHSLGGTAVPVIAQELEKGDLHPAGFVLMAASPRPLYELMREQYSFLYSLVPELTAEEQAEKDAIFAELDRFGNLDFLENSDMLMGVYLPYWKWLSSYNMLAKAESITAPCLVLQGEEDYQVSMKDFGLLKDALGSKENWQFFSFPGLTHLFTPGQRSDGNATYLQPEKMDPSVISQISSFILAE